MKIKLSKSQWEGIGKKAGWMNPELSKMPPMGKLKDGPIGEDAALLEENAIQEKEANRLFQLLLKNIESSVLVLTKRFYNTSDPKWVAEMRYDILSRIGNLIENMVEGHV